MLSSKIPTLLLYLCAVLNVSTALAVECTEGEPIEHTFASGASWAFCAVLDEYHALELQQLHYRAPGDTSRRVLQHLHLGQVLLHYHDTQTPDALIGKSKLGGHSLISLNDQICAGELHPTGSSSPKLCSFVRDTGLLSKYNLRPGLQGQQYQLFSVSEYQGLTLQIQIGLSEDGRIVPSVTLSGRASSATTDKRFGSELLNPVTNKTIIGTHASVLYTWRLAFALNDDAKNDIVEEFNFTLEPSLGNRRPMKITTFSTESLRNTDRNQFRGWRIRDANGSGYYLDPQNSGFGYTDLTNNWAQFGMALSTFKDCERHSYIGYTENSTENAHECLGSLDDFVNGETMSNSHPVVWYSVSRVFRPKAEDYPVISSMQAEFEIIPFDWTPTSPFELNQ